MKWSGLHSPPPPKKNIYFLSRVYWSGVEWSGVDSPPKNILGRVHWSELDLSGVESSGVQWSGVEWTPVPLSPSKKIGWSGGESIWTLGGTVKYCTISINSSGGVTCDEVDEFLTLTSWWVTCDWPNLVHLNWLKQHLDIRRTQKKNRIFGQWVFEANHSSCDTGQLGVWHVMDKLIKIILVQYTCLNC